MSITSHDPIAQNTEEPTTAAEQENGADELSASILGVIGAYGMGSVFNAQDLVVKRASAPASEPATAVVL